MGSSLADAIPAVKFVVKLFGKLTAQDDAALAALAFTIAYQQSVEQAVRAIGEPRKPFGEPAEIARKLRGLDDSITADALDFSRVSLDRAAEHPFVLHADGILAMFAEEVGYDERQRIALQSEVHQRFTVHLKTLLSHGGTADKFVEPPACAAAAGVGVRARDAKTIESCFVDHWTAHIMSGRPALVS